MEASRSTSIPLLLDTNYVTVQRIKFHRFVNAKFVIWYRGALLFPLCWLIISSWVWRCGNWLSSLIWKTNINRYHRFRLHYSVYLINQSLSISFSQKKNNNDRKVSFVPSYLFRDVEFGIFISDVNKKYWNDNKK